MNITPFDAVRFDDHAAVARTGLPTGLSRRLDAEMLRAQALAAGVRIDADETAVFARQLESIRAVPYDVRYPNLMADQLVPMGGGDVDPGAEYHTWRLMDRSGAAKRITNYNDDAPMADVQAAESINPLASYGIGYRYSFQDLRRARLANLPLDQKRALAARELLALAIDDVLSVGDADAGTKGFLNNANVPVMAAITGNWLLGSPTPTQVLADLNAMERDIITASKGVERPNCMALATDLYAYIATTPASTLTPLTTILEVFLKNSQGIKSVYPWYKLNTASATGHQRVVAWERNVIKVEGIVPVIFEQFAPVVRGMGVFVINCHARAGGTIVRYPGSMRYLDGCGS